MRALILSAGFGTRLRPFTEHIAKPAIPFLNIPIIGYPLFLAEKAAINEILINLHHLPETVKLAVTALDSTAKIGFVEESPRILDSGGGIKNAEEFLGRDENFWVFNGDTTCFFDDFNFLQTMRLSHEQSGAIATVLTCPFPEDKAGLGGVFVEPGKNTIDHFSREDRGLGLETYHYVGAGIYSRRIFEYLPAGQPSNIFYDGLTQAMKKGERAQVFVKSESLWLETGNPDDFLSATETCLHLLADKTSPFSAHLTEVMSRYVPDWETSFQCEPGLRLLQHPKSHLSERLKMSGTVVVGEGASVSSQATFKDVVILPLTQIGTDTEITKQILFKNESFS